MTIEDLKNTKIYLKTEDEFKKFQEKVLKLGIIWPEGGIRVLEYQRHPFIYICNRVMSSHPPTLYNLFIESKNKQIFLEDVLAIEEPVQLTSGMPVLVRDRSDKEWEYDVLGRIRSGECKYKCIGGAFYQCIPYEGNEHLLGASGSFSY